MFLVRIEFVRPSTRPEVIGRVAAIPSAGNYLVIDEDDAALYVQSSFVFVDPKPGKPVALIRITE